MRFSIKWKLVAAILLPLLAGFAINSFVNFRSLKRAAQAQTETYLLRAAELQAARFDARLERAAQVAQNTANLLTIDAAVTDAQLYEMLALNVSANPLIFGSCAAFDPDVSRGRDRFAPYAWRDIAGVKMRDLEYDYASGAWEWYSAPRETGKPVWTEPYFDKGGGEVVMCTYSAPIARRNTFAGVATVDVRLEDLQFTQPEPELDGFGGFVLISREGTFVSADDPALIMNGRIQDVVADGNVELGPLAEKMLKGERGVALLHDFPAPGQFNFVAFAPLESTGWTFVAMVREGEIMKPVYQELGARVLFSLLIVSAATAVMLLLSFRLTKPLETLAAEVARMGAGNLEPPALGRLTNDEIGDLTIAFNGMVLRLRAQIAEIEEQATARQAVESELNVARQIQLSMLPRTFPPFPERPEFHLHAANAPARHVAGDFFDFMFIGPDELMVVIADVSGKGVPAAMLMAATRVLLRNLASSGLRSSQIVSRMSEVLALDNQTGMFVTLIVAIYNVTDGTLVYTNAAHPPAHIVGGDGSVRSIGPPTGTVAGVIEGAAYHEHSAVIAPGEMLVFFTDGVPEARTAEGHFYGDKKFIELLGSLKDKSPEEVCKAVVESVSEFQQGHLHDDVTVVVLRRDGKAPDRPVASPVTRG